MKTLEELREEIDEIDTELHELLTRRIKIGQEVAKAKKVNGVRMSANFVGSARRWKILGYPPCIKQDSEFAALSIIGFGCFCLNNFHH